MAEYETNYQIYVVVCLGNNNLIDDGPGKARPI